MARIVRWMILAVSLLWGAGTLQAQHLEYGAALDTNYMLIGDQQQFKLIVKAEEGVKVIFPRLEDTLIKGVEILAGPIRDSIRQKDGNWWFEEKYVITAFDTGVYVIPEIPITIETEGYNNVLRTNPLTFIVNTFQVDPQKGNYDIVLPYAAPWTFAEIAKYVLWGILGLAVLGVALWLYLRYRKRQPLFTARKEEIPPYVKAIRSLDEIKMEKLWQAGREKEYYTKLTDTVRQYLDDEFQIPAMEQTSAETLAALKSCPQAESQETARLEEMMTTADFVKFAKFTPLQDENARYLDTAYDFVNHTHQRLQAERAEEERKAQEINPAETPEEQTHQEKETALGTKNDDVKN